MKKVNIAIDGACKGNPGPAGIGVVITDESGATLKEIGEYIGDATNNIAEYTALIRSLREAIDLGSDSVDIQSDSELMVRQINGAYRVRSEVLIPLYNEAKSLIDRFDSFTITYVPRSSNKHADMLASSAACTGKGKITNANFCVVEG